VFGISWENLLVLIVAGLFILGPERLPAAAAWLGKSVRKVREFASGAQQQLRDEMGPEFDEFKKPLEDLRELRNFDPRRAITNQLFDGDPDPLGLNGTSGGSSKPEPNPLKPGEKPPVDPDAT
jgi:sec-independent protein translocase protein TatB